MRLELEENELDTLLLLVNLGRSTLRNELARQTDPHSEAAIRRVMDHYAGLAEKLRGVLAEKP